MLATLEMNEKQKRSGSIFILPGLPYAFIRALPSSPHTFSQPHGQQDAVYTKMNKGVCDEWTTSNFKDKEKSPTCIQEERVTYERPERNSTLIECSFQILSTADNGAGHRGVGVCLDHPLCGVLENTHSWVLSAEHA